MTSKVSFKRGENSGGLIPDGIYRLRVEDVEEKPPGKSGFPYMNMRYAVIVRGQPQGGSIWDILSFSPNARFKIDQFLDSLNAPDTDQEVPPAYFKGKFVWAMITTEIYKDKKTGKEKIKNVVDTYITQDIAEQQLAGNDVDDGDSVMSTEPVKQAARPTPVAAARQRSRTAVAELSEDDDFPV